MGNRQPKTIRTSEEITHVIIEENVILLRPENAKYNLPYCTTSLTNAHTISARISAQGKSINHQRMQTLPNQDVIFLVQRWNENANIPEEVKTVLAHKTTFLPYKPRATTYKEHEEPGEAFLNSSLPFKSFSHQYMINL